MGTIGAELGLESRLQGGWRGNRLKAGLQTAFPNTLSAGTMQGEKTDEH